MTPPWSVTLGNAPVSYGVFEMTVGTDSFVAPVDRLLGEVASAGYRGIDLGPVGFLGEAEPFVRRLAQRGLGLCGGFIELPFGDADALEAALPTLDALLTTFDFTRDRLPGPPPRPTLAASASVQHRLRPGQAQTDTSIGLDSDGWLAFAAGLRRVLEVCRQRMYEPTFHPHVGTFVEAPREIERVLDLTDVGLCLDTGHLMVGGGDPATAIREWNDRINHVHLKDVSLSVLHDLIDSGEDAQAVWTRGVFCALGRGDLETDGVLAGLRDIGYGGWIVVEQDVIAPDEERFERAVADQRANRRYLESRGL